MTDAIDVRDVVFSYGKEPFIDGLSATFPHGRVTSIVGPNGCGKSTMIKLVDGLLRPQAGEVRVDGVPTLSLKAKERARRVAVLAQASRPPAMTVEALVACGRYPHQRARARLRARTAYRWSARSSWRARAVRSTSCGACRAASANARQGQASREDRVQVECALELAGTRGP
ncbi:ABC transporter ATP-binding protein [Eggerthella sinensis]|uniref:ATP-binding cassette domain-containing protein n=1 Tax=Eggerthella sinensis TaxID=242230 RepID=UPI0022E2AE23|nr:ABC transporter ATP-binding protein [Eggerthella sinensis]